MKRNQTWAQPHWKLSCTSREVSHTAETPPTTKNTVSSTEYGTASAGAVTSTAALVMAVILRAPAAAGSKDESSGSKAERGRI